MTTADAPLGRKIGVGHASGDPLVDYRESKGELALVVRRPTTRYFDQFLRLRSAPDMLALSLFPTAKEITETLAAVEITTRHGGMAKDDEGVAIVCVGDGATPRTAATFALRTAWTCHSVDPALGTVERFASIERLHIHPCRAQRFTLEWPGPVVVVAVHAHVRVSTVIERLRSTGCDVVAAVVLPCCGFERTDPPAGMKLVRSAVDWGIWSPYRTIEVWRP